MTHDPGVYGNEERKRFISAFKYMLRMLFFFRLCEYKCWSTLNFIPLSFEKSNSYSDSDIFYYFASTPMPISEKDIQIILFCYFLVVQSMNS